MVALEIRDIMDNMKEAYEEFCDTRDYNANDLFVEDIEMVVDYYGTKLHTESDWEAWEELKEFQNYVANQG